jgi:hypothetical protein
VAHDRREIAHRQQWRGAALGLAQERDHARLGVTGVDPLESRLIEVELMQRRLRAQHGVEIADPALHAGVLGER